MAHRSTFHNKRPPNQQNQRTFAAKLLHQASIKRKGLVECIPIIDKLSIEMINELLKVCNANDQVNGAYNLKNIKDEIEKHYGLQINKIDSTNVYGPIE